MNRIFSILLGLLTAMSATAAELASGEWFIDSDPGRGAGTSFAVPGVSIATASVAVPAATINALTPGYHLLGVRMLDAEGEWGHVIWRGFHKEVEAPGPRLLSAGEWFLNEDPGIGLGTAIPLASAPSAGASVSMEAAIFDALPSGFHLLGVRLLDDEGEWGAVVWRGIHKGNAQAEAPQIASVEYRIIRDGGIVSALTKHASPPSGVVTLAVSHGKVNLMLGGEHLVQAIPIDVHGQRGHAVNAVFDYKTYANVWIEQHFTEAERNDPEISGDDADPDGDGLSNKKERYFALNPRNAGDVSLGNGLIEMDGNSLPMTVSFRVPAGGTVGLDGVYRTSNLRYTLQHNADLGMWIDVPSAWIEGYAIADVGDGAARLVLSLMPEAAAKRFFVLQGDLE